MNVPRTVIEIKEVSIPEAKKILEKDKEPSEFQRRTMDYLTKFSKVESKDAKKLHKVLSKKFKLKPKEIIQIINCMPQSIEELRVILSVKGKVILSNELQAILEEINNYKIVK